MGRNVKKKKKKCHIHLIPKPKPLFFSNILGIQLYAIPFKGKGFGVRKYPLFFILFVTLFSFISFFFSNLINKSF